MKIYIFPVIILSLIDTVRKCCKILFRIDIQNQLIFLRESCFLIKCLHLNRILFLLQKEKTGSSQQYTDAADPDQFHPSSFVHDSSLFNFLFYHNIINNTEAL